MRDHTDSAGHLPPSRYDVQAMDYVQAKIESLVTLMETEDASIKHFNPEKMRFQDMEQNIRAQFHMPKREKLVNCVWVWGGEGRPR